MKNILKALGTIAILLCSLTLVHAQSLQEAKDQGLIGEQRDGYIGLVVADAPAAVRALVQEVNDQRRQQYERIARDNGIELSQVATLAYQRAVEATRPGHFIQNSAGSWVKK